MRIKLKLSKYYGEKTNEKLPGYYFIKEKENDTKNEIIEYEKQIPKK